LESSSSLYPFTWTASDGNEFTVGETVIFIAAPLAYHGLFRTHLMSIHIAEGLHTETIVQS
jgi:hypothetical protein